MTHIVATYIDHMGSDLSVVNAARVSFGKKSEWNPNFRDEPPLYERDAKLIHYLAKHKHMSPFGHAFASFHVKAPIFVARQLVKHKFLRWNEISRRYVDDEPEFYMPEVWRGRAEDKKQGSADWSVPYDTIPLEVRVNYNPYEGYEYQNYHELCLELYKDILSYNIAPEQARMVLPQSTMTEWYWSGSLDAFADMCRLRCKDDTQYETRLVADQISVIMEDLFPVSWKALVDAK